MDTNALKKFAQAARNLLIDQVGSKLELVLDPASPSRREHPLAMRDLDSAIVKLGKVQVVEQVAYTWFNRFTALRFMDAMVIQLPASCPLVRGRHALRFWPRQWQETYLTAHQPPSQPS